MNLEGWKHPLQLSVDLLFQTLLNLKDYGFKYQITHIELSVPRNTAEGWEHDSLKESLQFLSHTKIPMENYENKYTIGMKINSIAAETGLRWIQETKEISVMLAGLSKTRRKLLSD